MNKRKKQPLKYFFLAVIFLIAVIYIFPKVSRIFSPSYIVSYGELKVSDEAETCIVRREKVYLAESSGKTNYYIDENTLVRRGTKVMDLTESVEGEWDEKYADIVTELGKNAVNTGDFAVEEVGIVSYYTDGDEAKLTPESMKKLSYEAFSGIKDQKAIELKRDSVLRGEPVFKVVDRTNWYMVCFLDKKSKDRYEAGQTLQVEFEDDAVDATVLSARVKDGKLRLILETDYFYQNFAKIRTADTVLTTKDEKGLLIDNRSIKKVKGQQGVYVRNRAGEYGFVPVQIKLTDGKQSLVTDGTFYNEKGEPIKTVKIYDEILKKPK